MRKQNRNKERSIIITSTLFCVVAAVIIGVPLPRSFAKYSRCTDTTMASVVDYSRKWVVIDDSRDELAYVPILRYQVNGVDYKAAADCHFSVLPVDVGDYMQIYYNPGDPSEFCLPDEVNRLPRQTALGVVGVLTMLSAVVIVIFRPKQKNT